VEIGLQKNSWLVGVHMSDQDKDGNGGLLRFLWTKIEDIDSSIEAARTGGILAGWISAGSALQTLMLFFSGKTLLADLQGISPSDKFEYYFQLLIGLILVIFFAYLTYRIYEQKKFGFVPFVSIFYLYDASYKFYLFGSTGIFISSGLVLTIAFSILALNALRGWFSIKRYKNLDSN
jgi:hypothetical protein